MGHELDGLSTVDVKIPGREGPSQGQQPQYSDGDLTLTAPCVQIKSPCLALQDSDFLYVYFTDQAEFPPLSGLQRH